MFTMMLWPSLWTHHPNGKIYQTVSDSLAQLLLTLSCYSETLNLKVQLDPILEIEISKLSQINQAFLRHTMIVNTKSLGTHGYVVMIILASLS